MAKEKERFELLLEEIKGDIKGVAEGHETIRSEMRQMEQRLAEKIDENTSAIKFVAAKVNTIGEKLDEHIRSRCSDRDPATHYNLDNKEAGQPAHAGAN